MRIANAVLLFALSVKGASFDVVSIRPSSPDEQGTHSQSNDYGMRIGNFTVRRIISRAYDIPEERITGGPKWLDQNRFNIEARVERPVKDMKPLLQSLLQERFGIRLRRESRLVTGYLMVVAKGGLKVAPTAPGTPNHDNGSRGNMDGANVSMSRLAGRLTALLGFPVDDGTGVTGGFDFSLRWNPDENAVSELPSIFTAMPEQLGLKLEARKVAVDFLTVESATLPSEN